METVKIDQSSRKFRDLFFKFPAVLFFALGDRLHVDSSNTQVRVPNVIALVGLPARGKTYISHKLCRYLNWIGIKTKAFNVGEYRRKACTPATGECNFFSPYNAAGTKIRDECARLAIEDMARYLESKEGEVAVRVCLHFFFMQYRFMRAWGTNLPDPGGMEGFSDRFGTNLPSGVR
ncbi:unnamed protein product [Nippostrongylus brasiliensis]|uniref:6PF2K domain-containing protein n=1 Tax=Nippostrongylus brasiliensis TaxID=27835 RepID=A0A0N4YEG8_NIPBR|nr:unnamed protein product [Nippostrongylus brasiliensis]